jgi:hypothetical protein
MRDEDTSGPCSWHDGEDDFAPAELIAFWEESRHLPLDDGPEIAVASPRDGERFVLDPLVPRDAQGLVLEAQVHRNDVTQVDWLVDGKPVAVSAPNRAALWPLEAGSHDVVAVATLRGGEGRLQSATATIFVERDPS